MFALVAFNFFNSFSRNYFCTYKTQNTKRENVFAEIFELIIRDNNNND